jgi:hypothetical protein
VQKFLVISDEQLALFAAELKAQGVMNSGAARRESREKALEAARRWRLDLLATLDHRRAHLPGSHRRTLGAVE